jgi:propane monooxygenase reductase subunit
VTQFDVRMQPTDRRFVVVGDEPVLEAGLRGGVNLAYGCRHGNCSTCKYQLIDGEVDFGAASPYSLSEAERDEGWVLLCCAQALTDLEIRDRGRVDHRLRPLLAPAERTAMVLNTEQVSSDLWALRVGIDEPLQFYAGQFVELSIPDSGLWRSYSIASAASESRELEFVVKRIEGGSFSGQIDSLEAGAPLRLRGPYGNGYLRAGTDPVLLVAISSGIAPVLSILRTAAEEGDTRSFTLVYGARTRADLVLVDEVERLQAELDLRFCPTLSQPTPQCKWAGHVGRVTQVVQREVSDASNVDAYLCGKPAMCDSIGLLLEAKGADESRILFDPFYPASTQRHEDRSTVAAV